jgi:signal peptidase II
MQETPHAGTLKIRGILLAAALAALIFVVDRITKIYFMNVGTSHRQEIIRGLLDIIYHENRGIIANFPLPMWLTLTITIAVIAAIAVVIRNAARRGDVLSGSALGLILGGAIGNLYDRLTQGFVFDWILLFERSAINVADFTIVVGAVWFFYIRSEKEKRSETSGRS